MSAKLGRCSASTSARPLLRCGTHLTSRKKAMRIHSCAAENCTLDRGSRPLFGVALSSLRWLHGHSVRVLALGGPAIHDSAAACDTGRCNAATSHADQTPALTRAPGETGYTSQPRKRTCTKGDYGPFGIRWGRRLVHDTNGSVKVRTTTASQGAGCNGSRLFL